MPGLFGGMGVRAFAHSPFLQAFNHNFIETDKVLVIVYLGGGADGLNMLVPTDSYSQLTKARPDVILPEKSLLRLQGVSNLGLHPSMSALQALYNEGQMAVVQNVGYPEQNYSHFRSTDIWMTGSSSDEVLTSGWLGRYLNHEFPNYPVDYPNAVMPDPLAIQIGYNLSVAFQGPVSAMGMVVGDPTSFYNLVNNIEEPVENSAYGSKLGYVRLISKQSQIYGQVVKSAAGRVNKQSAYPADNYLADQLKVVARLIAGGLKTRVYMVTHDGFDTHSNQVDGSDHTKGAHATLLKKLSEAVSAFQKDLDYQNKAERVLTMTVSEFGRRIISNASMGTDHGAAAPVMLFGKQVKPGIIGKNPVLPAEIGVEDNLQMQYDFRSIYSTVLKDWFCLGENEVQALFSDVFPSLPLLASSPCITTAAQEEYRQAGKSWVEIYPNPFTNSTRISFEADDTPLSVQLFNPSGQMMAQIAKGRFSQGRHEVTWDGLGVPAGNYFVRYQNQRVQQGKWVVKVN